MKIAEIRQMSDAELQENLDKLEVKLFDLRFAQAMGKLETPSAFKLARKSIAKIKTVVTERAKAEVANV